METRKRQKARVQEKSLPRVLSHPCTACHACKRSIKGSHAVVTLLRKAASYEPRIAILGIWGDNWLTRGKYGIYVAVHGSYGVYVTPSGKWREMSKFSKFCHVKSALYLLSCLLRGGNEDTLVSYCRVSYVAVMRIPSLVLRIRGTTW